MTQFPPHLLLIGEDGTPEGVLDVEKLRLDASLLAYEFAAASGDSDELDRIGAKWADKLSGPYRSGVVSGAFSLVVREILEPVLQLLEEVRPDIPLRAKLAECRDEVARMADGGGGA